MLKLPETKNPSGSLRAGATQQTEDQQIFEERVESRAEALNKLVTDLSKSLFPSLGSDVDSMDEKLEQLLIKEAQLRWLVRVARYSQGANRQALWLAAKRALVELEDAADAMLHAECV